MSGIPEVAAELAAEVPPKDRETARRLLAEHVIPYAVAAPPERLTRALLERASERLRERLDEVDPDERLLVIDGLAAEAALDEHAREAFSLAVARFLLDHRPALEPLAPWLTPAARHWAERGGPALLEEAAQRRWALDRWREGVQRDHPDVWQRYSGRWVAAGRLIGAAESGSFDTSSGELYDFLTAAGADTRLLDVF